MKHLPQIRISELFRLAHTNFPQNGRATIYLFDVNNPMVASPQFLGGAKFDNGIEMLQDMSRSPNCQSSEGILLPRVLLILQIAIGFFLSRRLPPSSHGRYICRHRGCPDIDRKSGPCIFALCYHASHSGASIHLRSCQCEVQCDKRHAFCCY